MKVLWVALVIVQALLAAGETPAKKQQLVNQLLYKTTEPIPDSFTDIKKLSETFNPIADTSIYSDDGAAAKILLDEIEHHRVLEKHNWFSLFNERQRHEALMLFKVLVHCKEWECFLGNAAYFREQMNEGEFVYALYTGIIHSIPTQGIVLPPLYEITPHMFTNSEVINKAYSSHMTRTPGEFRMNFTGSQRNPEQRVAYFGEDIGLNTHHVSWHMVFPFWWEDSYGHHLDRKGELFFWVHHQLTARFDSERLSNNLGMVDELYWNKPILEGFAPDTTYKYGGEFPARPDNVKFEDVDGVAKVRDMINIESRIRDAIAHGYITDVDGKAISIRNEKGIDILGNIIESSMYSPNTQYYGALHNLAHIMLGRQADPHGKFNMPPGVMEHFETATRDPSFFRLHKYMDNIFKEHLDGFAPYTRDELDFPGVKITKVSSSPLKTFFEDFKFDLGMAVDSSPGSPEVPLTAVVSRLNHEDFTVELEIDNNGDEKVGTIRLFLCPANDENGIYYSFDHGRWHCIELDKFWKTLQPGVNKVTRHSKESSVTVPDIPSYKTLVDKADHAVQDGTVLDLTEYARSCGIPDRMLLPKGKPEGLDFWLSAFVSDAHEDTDLDHPESYEHGGTHSQCGVHGQKYPDKKPLGYPFNRRIPDNNLFLSINTFGGEHVKVFHDDHH